MPVSLDHEVMRDVELRELFAYVFQVPGIPGPERYRNGSHGDAVRRLAGGVKNVSDLQPVGEVAANNDVVTKLTVKLGS